jgi:hypothetical protein
MSVRISAHRHRVRGRLAPATRPAVGYNPPITRAERRRLGSTRLIGLHDDDGAFDRAFWDAVPPHARLEAVWDLTLEFLALQGQRGDQPRLQRSVCRVERRAG